MTTTPGWRHLLGFGTGTVNFFGRYAYVGEGRDGLDAVVWTEPDEPQAAIGSHLQKSLIPPITKSTSRAIIAAQEAYEHHGKDISI